MSAAVIGTWDEPEGATARGTVIVVPGRGEDGAAYQRFGRRISSENWKVRLIALNLDDLVSARSAVQELIGDESLPSPKVLVGADAGAAWVRSVVDEVGADAAIIAGVALASSVGTDDWESEIAARSACPVHRTVLEASDSFERGALNRALPEELTTVTVPSTPVLVLHGEADPVTPVAEAIAPYVDAAQARVRVLRGGVHDVLNDAIHRVVAATIVLFLESVKAGPDLPDIVIDPAR
ncbi:alpha/beta hydrolase [Cumulibacter soli]|uniref:alpha/beta hydrolase n=1 Tax=Cumulibacter soli TaxID=2546344 RepID=UPI001068B6C7|nr:alpha/beta hydrolase [Cumulibacter soli]